MDVREKLVEILKQAPFEGKVLDEWWWEEKIKRIADHLISNGVTVQEWVSVKDRLPEAGEYVVCIAKRNPFSMFMPMVARIEKNGWVNPITEQYISEVTHWMPLPEPPKEVLTMPIDEYMKAACWIVCPMCDEPKCVGRINCPEIKAWIEKKRRADHEIV